MSLDGLAERQDSYDMRAREIIVKLGGRAIVAKATAAQPNTVSYWMHRDSIPAKHWHSLLSLAAAREVPDVTLDMLVTISTGQHRRVACPICAERALREAAQDGRTA